MCLVNSEQTKTSMVMHGKSEVFYEVSIAAMVFGRESEA